MEILFEIDSLEDFERIVQQTIQHLTYSVKNESLINKEIQPIDMKEAENHVKKLLSDNHFDMKNITLSLIQKNWDRDRIKYFVTLLEKKKTELLYASLNHHNSEYGETVIHTDWLMKLVLGTSELNTMKYPLLQVILSTIGANGVQNKKMYELNREMARKTIQALEHLSQES